jgi:hypothetical protein
MTWYEEIFDQVHILIVLPLGLLLVTYFSTPLLQAVFIYKLVHLNQFQLGPRSVGAFRNVYIRTRTELVSENCWYWQVNSVHKSSNFN